MAKATKVGEPIKQARWYKGEQFEYEENLKNKGKVVGYFKTVANRRHGNRQVYRYYKVHENGIMVYVDSTMMKTGVAQGIATPYQFRPSTKREWDTQLKQYFKRIL